MISVRTEAARTRCPASGSEGGFWLVVNGWPQIEQWIVEGCHDPDAMRIVRAAPRRLVQPHEANTYFDFVSTVSAGASASAKTVASGSTTVEGEVSASGGGWATLHDRRLVLRLGRALRSRHVCEPCGPTRLRPPGPLG